jgi:hypothetical protein
MKQFLLLVKNLTGALKTQLKMLFLTSLNLKILLAMQKPSIQSWWEKLKALEIIGLKTLKSCSIISFHD